MGEAIRFTYLTENWCSLSSDASVIIITDHTQSALAACIAEDIPNPCAILPFDDSGHFVRKLKKLRSRDLVIALFSFDTYIQGAHRFFSPFEKPKGVVAKYAFVRLGISKESLLQGLSTPKELIRAKIAKLIRFEAGDVLRVTNAAGTDITLCIDGFGSCDYEIIEDGGMAFLPPSEIAAGVLPGKASGKIAVDVTVGQLYLYRELLAQFGLVNEPILLIVENSAVKDVTGGDMAKELKKKLFALPAPCRELVELGHGLSDMKPTGLIGVDESIIHTCHFGIGNGGKCGVHLDVVISQPSIVEIKPQPRRNGSPHV